MHEVGVISGMLDMVAKRAADHPGRQVERIVLTVGTLSGVGPEALETAFKSMGPGSIT